jgi:DNA-binding transcriptional regulator YiaG
VPNLNQILKIEISRLARKQARLLTVPLRKDVARLKRVAAGLKRTVALLQKQAEVLLGAEARRSSRGPAMSEGELAGVRLTGAAIRRMRRKMRLTQSEFARLTGTSAVTVCLWERRGRKQLQLRGESKAKVAKLIGVSAEEAKMLLERLAGPAPARKAKRAPARKKAKAAGRKKAARKTKKAKGRGRRRAARRRK